MQSTVASVDEYLKTVPLERIDALTRLRQMCLRTLSGHEEGMAYGMPSYGKNGIVEIAFNSQKNYISLYILKKDILDRYRSQLKDAGKACIRYRQPQHIDFALVENLLEETAASSGDICP